MIIGIDPGVRKLGFAVMHDDGAIVDIGILLLEEKGKVTREVYYERMAEIYQFFVEMLDKYTITKAGVEKLFFTDANQSNAEFVYGVR